MRQVAFFFVALSTFAAGCTGSDKGIADTDVTTDNPDGDADTDTDTDVDTGPHSATTHSGG